MSKGDKAKKTRSPHGYLLWQVSMVWQRKMKHALDSVPLTYTQFVIMEACARLCEEKKNVSQIDLAKECKVDRMMTSKVLRTLEDKGIIVRLENKNDIRVKSVRLTAKGEKLLVNAKKVVEIANDEFFSGHEAKPKAFFKQMNQLLKANFE